MADGMASPGVVVLGGAHGTIALARELQPLGVPVWFVTDDNVLPRFSRHVHRSLTWAGTDDPAAAAAFLEDAADRFGLKNYILVASADAEVEFVSRQYDRLSRTFVLTLPPWEQLEWACEKARAYERAIELGIGVPSIFSVRSWEEATRLALQFPIVLKPSSRVARNAFTLAKAWKIERAEDFLPAFGRAAGHVGVENVVIQELVPGGGECQFSYAALWNEGRPVAEFAARRTRQFPVEFGFTSTFVETVDAPDVVEAGRRFADSIRHHGLIEIEFKRDPRNGQLKLLDVNPRPWSWLGLAAAAGMPLGHMQWAAATGKPIPAGSVRTGVAWMYLLRDLVSGATLIGRGQLSLGSYIASFGKVRAWATFAGGDPMPALADPPLAVARLLKKRLLPRLRAHSSKPV